MTDETAISMRRYGGGAIPELVCPGPPTASIVLDKATLEWLLEELPADDACTDEFQSLRNAAREQLWRAV